MSSHTPTSASPVVVFDAVGTLIYPDPSAADVYARYGREYGSQMTVDEIAVRFSNAFHQQEQADQLDKLRRRNTTEQRERERWRTIVTDVFEEVPHASNELFDDLWEHFSQGRHWQVFGDVVETWQTLQKQGYLLAIASNFDDRLPQICQEHHPLNSCRHIFWSAEIGYPKPSPEFFARVTARLKVPSNQIFFVGDSLVNDFQGAHAAGWNVKLLTRGETSLSQDHRITSLCEVVPWVAG